MIEFISLFHLVCVLLLFWRCPPSHFCRHFFSSPPFELEHQNESLSKRRDANFHNPWHSTVIQRDVGKFCFIRHRHLEMFSFESFFTTLVFSSSRKMKICWEWWKVKKNFSCPWNRLEEKREYKTFTFIDEHSVKRNLFVNFLSCLSSVWFFSNVTSGSAVVNLKIPSK